MTIYLIDIENVGNSWIDLLQITTKDDKIIAFYTDKSAKISLDNLSKIRNEFVKMYGTKTYNVCKPYLELFTKVN